ncbi:MAG: extracellular solute-binding protein [Intrasporangiaceae bacterium]|nr:extracellular solute-binding protein [Intrasporangiaceae bacterium]
MRSTRMLIALTAGAALALTGCGRDDGGSGDAAAPETGADVSAENITGEIDVWAMGAEGEKLPGLAAQFEEAHEGVTVNVTAIPWDSAHDKFTTSITAGTTPDVAMVGTTWMGEFAGLDALDPAPGSIDASKFFEGAQETAVVDGTAYGVPWYVETRLVYYRTDIAEQAGYTEVPTDWEGFKQMAAEEYFQSFFTDGIANPAPPEGQTEADFTSGTVPMFISGPWMRSLVEDMGGEGFAEKYDVAPIPVPEGGSSSSFVGGSNLAVFKDTENRDTAWAFVEWLTEPETQVSWFEETTNLPSVQTAWEDEALAADEKLAAFGTQLESAQAPPSFPTWEEVVTSFDTAMEQVAKAEADPQEVLDGVQVQAESIGTGQ